MQAGDAEGRAASPGFDGRTYLVRNPDVARLTSKMEYAVPIRRVTFGADNGRSNRITMPAAPWEAAQ